MRYACFLLPFLSFTSHGADVRHKKVRYVSVWRIEADTSTTLVRQLFFRSPPCKEDLHRVVASLLKVDDTIQDILEAEDEDDDADEEQRYDVFISRPITGETPDVGLTDCFTTSRLRDAIRTLEK